MLGVAAWRALEARLGFDPDEAPEGLIEKLGSMETALGRQAVEEAAVAGPGSMAAETLSTVLEASKASKLRVSLRVTEAITIRFDPRYPAWRWGEDAAREVRHVLGVDDVFGADAFAAILEVPWTEVAESPATADRLEYSALLRHGAASANLALRMNPLVHRRFEIARMIGDAIWVKTEAFGVISRAKTERQKFQRGFAVALLCPFSELRRYIDLESPTTEQIIRAGRRFGVHETVVRTVLVNKNVLPRETLLDRLEAA